MGVSGFQEMESLSLIVVSIFVRCLRQKASQKYLLNCCIFLCVFLFSEECVFTLVNTLKVSSRND